MLADDGGLVELPVSVVSRVVFAREAEQSALLVQKRTRVHSCCVD